MIDFKVVLNLWIGWSTRIRRTFVLHNMLYQLINSAEIRTANDAISNVNCWVFEILKWKDNNERTAYEDARWVHLAQGRFQKLVLANTVFFGYS
jgi:uncharacterized protein (DUF2225 family)